MKSPIYASAVDGCKTCLNMDVNKIHFYRILGYALISMLIKKNYLYRNKLIEEVWNRCGEKWERYGKMVIYYDTIL